MSAYKLYYLYFRGLGEPIRMLFHYVQQPFEVLDIRLESFEAVKKLKHEFPYEKVPVLVIGGKERIAQQQAILRYLGKQFNLQGKTDIENAHIDSVACLMTDFHIRIRPYIHATAKATEDDLQKMINEHLVPGVQEFFPLFEKVLKESGSGYYSKSGLTWVDFSCHMQWLKTVIPDVVKQFPLLDAHGDRVHALPTLQEYLKNRP